MNAPDAGYGRTPLHYACWAGQLDGVVALLAAGASILSQSTADCYDADLPCNAGTTPLHLAAMKGYQSIVVRDPHALPAASSHSFRYKSERLGAQTVGTSDTFMGLHMGCCSGCLLWHAAPLVVRAACIVSRVCSLHVLADCMSMRMSTCSDS